jgi:hypothetical protein
MIMRVGIAMSFDIYLYNSLLIPVKRNVLCPYRPVELLSPEY